MSSKHGISLAERGEPRGSERISREQNAVILEDNDELHDFNRPQPINDRSSVGGAMRGTQSSRSSRSSQAIGPRLSVSFSSKSLSRVQSASAVAAAGAAAHSDAPSKFFDKFVHFFDFFFPRTFSSLEIPAAFIKNCTRHRSPKNYFSLDKKRTFRAFRIHSSETFRKVHIFCALLLAFLPTIEVPMSLASPCWLSFLLELICYSVISLRVMVDSLCFATNVKAHPWATLMRTALFISWVDVVVCMCLVASNGGSFLSFNNCGMPEPSSEPRSMAWVYIISRVSRFVRPIYFMEWNYRTRYLFNNMVRITSKLVRILSILFVVIFLFAGLAYFVWSDPNRYISSFPYRFDFFRSWPSSFVTMMTLTTTENYPDCMIDYMSVSFVNFFFFLIFVLLSVFFALNVVLSTVYDTYEENLQVYFFRRLLRDNATMAQAYQYLCDSDKKLSRERFFKFMKVYSGLNDLDEKKAANREKLQELNMQCDMMFSMCCIRRRLLLSDVNLDLKADIQNGKNSEVVLLQQLEALTKDPISFSDFLELVSLIRCTFVIKKGGARAKSKFEYMKRIPFATITTQIAMLSDDCCLKDYPISTHSTSYFFESGDISTRNLATVLAHDDGPLNASLVNPGDVFSGIFSAQQPPTESANAQSLLQEAPVRRFIRMVHDHKVSKLVCNLIIVLQFVLCVVQTAASNAFMQCSRYTQEDSIAKDPWMACDTFSWFRANNAEFIETAFNAAHLSLSSVLLIDIIVVLFLQKSRFLYTEHKEIDWINVIDSFVQAAIFMYDLIDIPFRASAGAVSRPEFVTFGIFRLLRVHKVLMLSTTIRDTLKLFRHLYPVVKSFFLIAYMFFFIWAILGMSLFSYAATENGIALYPNKSQYISFYDETRRESSTDYPNGNNPGNFGCNDTDVLGSPGLCGEYGPTSPLPFWDITPDSPDEEVALNRAFDIGSGLDARVGGCYNLVGQANDRVLPCYCFNSAEMMNRTTSCDWINPKWYKTQFGQSGYWILNFNDFKVACVHLFGIMIVNNWNTFYYSYQTVFGRAISVYFLTFYFFIVVVTYSLLISFVMEAFFLYYKKTSEHEGSDLTLSEKLRAERKLAFAIVCCIEHNKRERGILHRHHILYGGKKETVDDAIRDLFASENPQELELDDDPASYFPSFQVVSPTDEKVVLMLCHLIPQRLVFALLFFSLPSFILFSIYFFYLRRHADDDNLFFRLWKKATSLFRSNLKLNLAAGFAVLQKEELQNLCGGVWGISFVNVLQSFFH